MNSEIETTRCQPDHHIFRLPISKYCRNKRKFFSENFKHIKEELGPGNPNWFEDVTDKKLQEKKKTINILTSPVSLINGSYLSPCGSSTTNFTPENITTPNLHDLLQSQTLTPTPINKWIPPSLGDSPFMEDPFKISQKSQASSTPMIKSLGIDPDQSQLSWTSSLATPTLNSSIEIDSQNLEEVQDKQKGLPRALFSPGPSSTDNDSFMCLDNTIEPDDPRKNCPKSPKVFENKLRSIDETNELENTVVRQEIKNKNVCDEFSMPLFSQDSPDVNNNENGIKEIVKVKQEVEKNCGTKQENQDIVTETLSDFFDPPSGSVGRRRCAPSRGKKRKSIENDAFDDLVIKCEKESPVFSSQVKTKRFNPRRKGKDENSVVSLNKSDLDTEEEAITSCLIENKTVIENLSPFNSCQKAVKSILSSNKKQVKSQKKVRFSESLENYCDDLQEVVHKQESSNDVKSDKSMLNSTIEVESTKSDPNIIVEDKQAHSVENYYDDLQEVMHIQESSNDLKLDKSMLKSTREVDSTKNDPVVSVKNKQILDKEKLLNEKYVEQCSSGARRYKASVTNCQSNLKANTENLCQVSPIKNLSHTMLRGERKSSSDSDQADELLFSQVSPTALQEMCKVVTKVSDSDRQDITLSRDRKETDIVVPKANKQLEGVESHQVKFEIDGTNNGQLDTPKKEENIVEVNKTQKEDQLKLGKKRKFLYPTSSQIAKSKPKTLYGIGTGYESEQIKKEKNEICIGNESSASKITYDVMAFEQKPTGLAGENEVPVKVNNSTVKLESEQKPQMKSNVKQPIDSDQVVPLIIGGRSNSEQGNEEILRERMHSIQPIESNNMQKDQKIVDIFNERKKLDNMNQVCIGFVSGKGNQLRISEESMNKADTLFQEENSDSKHGDNTKSENFTEIVKLKKLDCGWAGFALAKDSVIAVGEDTLKMPDALFQEVNKECQIDGKKSNKNTTDIVELKNINQGCVGFVSAKGSRVVISEDALKKATTLFQEDSEVLKAEKINEKEGSKSDVCKINENKNFENLTNLKKIVGIENVDEDICSLKGPTNSIKRPSSLVEQSQDIDDKKYNPATTTQKKNKRDIEFNQECPGFSLASGQHVSLSSKSLKMAEKLFNESNDVSFVGETDIKNSGDNAVFTVNGNDIEDTSDDSKVTHTCDKFENSEYKSGNQRSVSKFQKTPYIDFTSGIKNSGDVTISEEKALDNHTEKKGSELGYSNQEGMDVCEAFMADDEDNFVFSQDDQDLRLMDIDSLTNNETKLDDNKEIELKHKADLNEIDANHGADKSENSLHMNEKEAKHWIDFSENKIKCEKHLSESKDKHGIKFSETELKNKTHLSEREDKHGECLSERTPDRLDCLSDVEIKPEADVGDIMTGGFKTASGKSLILSDDKLRKAKLTFQSLDEHIEEDGMTKKSYESKDSAKASNFDHLHNHKTSADLNFKNPLMRKTNQNIKENKIHNSDDLQSRNKKNFERNEIVFQTARQTATYKTTSNDKGGLLVSEFHKDLSKNVDEDCKENSHENLDKTDVIKEVGHLPHGEFRHQKSNEEGDFNKATSLMSEFYNELYKHDSITVESKNYSGPGFSTAGGKTIGLYDSAKKPDSFNSELTSKFGNPIDFPKNNEKDLKIVSGMGFSTAGGKNIALNSLIKHPLISEFKELYDSTSFTDKEKNDQKELEIPLKGFTMASGKSLNLKDSNVSKAHSLISEFQNEISRDSDPLELIIASKKSLHKRSADESDKMLHERSSNEKCHETVLKDESGPKFDSAVSANAVPKTCDELSDINNFDNVLKQFSAKKNQGFKIPLKSEKQTMKSATISARFPPGSSVPKGFRPFKAPKIISKPKTPVTSSSSPKTKIEPKVPSSDLPVGGKDLNTKYSASKQCLEDQSNDSLNLNNNVIVEKHTKDKDFDMDLDSSMINQMFADDLEASQKFSPKSGKPVKMDDPDVKEYGFNTKEHGVQDCLNHLEKCETHQTVNSAVQTKSEHSGEVIVGTDSPSVSSSKMSNVNGFQTASGRTLEISENSLSKALTFMNDTYLDLNICRNTVKDNEENNKKEEKIEKDGTKDTCDNREKTCDISEEKKNETAVDTCSVLQRILEPFEENEHDFITKSNAPLSDFSSGKFPLFQTASGKNVKISESALSKVRNLFQENTDEECEVSTSEKDIGLSNGDESLKNAEIEKKSDLNKKDNKTFYDQNKNVLGTNVMSENNKNPSFVDQHENSVEITHEIEKEKSSLFRMDLFQTASGKSVSVSKEALEKVKSNHNEMFEDLLDNIENHIIKRDNLHSFADIPTTKQSTFTMQQFQEDKLCSLDSFTESSPSTQKPFITASGKNVSIFQNAIYKAKSILDGTDNIKSSIDSNCLPDVQFVKNISIGNSDNPFQTASGKKIGVSAQALSKARQQLKECENETFSNKNAEDNDRGSEGKIEPMKVENEPPNKNVTVQCSTFMEPKMVLEQMTDKCHEDLDLISGKPKSQINSMCPFMSASGKSVGISESSLKQARQILGNDIEKSDIENRTSGQKSRSLTCSAPFQSASGKNIQISKKALEQARKTLDSNDISGFTGEIISGDVARRSHNTISVDKSDLRGTKSPFQSAAGKSVSVSITALNKARESLSSGNTTKNSSTSQIDLQVHKSGSYKNEEFCHSGSFTSEDDFLVPESIFDEMEPPQKKFKTDLNEDQKKDRKTMIPCTATPEGYSMDRRSTEIKLKPLQCHSLHRQRSRVPVLSYENSDNKFNSDVTKTMFKTPYKILKAEVIDSPRLQHGSTKSPMPVFIPKSNQKREVCNISGTNISEISSNGRNESLDLMSGFEDHMEIDTPEQTGIGKISKNRIELIQEARNKQREIINNKKLHKIKQVTGRLLRMKMESDRLSLRDVIDINSTSTRRTQLLGSEVSRSVKNVRASNSSQYTFQLRDYYGNEITHVYVGDGAYLVPRDDGTAGKEEFFNAFLTIDGIDPGLINQKWFDNHYSLIVWKLAAYEVISPWHFAGRSLTPEMLLLQVKYRYDREVDRCHRSALKKILERDDSAGKRMVLCVCDIQYRHDNKTDKQTTAFSNNQSSQVSLEVTDGWYRVHVQLDTPLTQLVHKGHIKIGHKLCVSGAELIGTEDACTPLEAPSSVMLKFHMNSTRPVTWDTKLGYQNDPCPLCVPITGLHGDGGLIGCLDVVVARKYPLMYMEKVSEGVSIFRSEQAEEKAKQAYQNIQQEKMENLYRKLESRFESEEVEDKCISKKRWTRKEVEYLQSGQEIYEALSTTHHTDILESYLSHHQMALLMDYRRHLQDEKRQKLQAEFQKAWNDGEQNSTSRNVIPLIKFRVVGCAKKDLDRKASTVITVWRPTSEIMEIEEGKRYKIFSLNASSARSKYIQNEVQLTATRQTRFKLLPIDENLLDILYEPREVSSVADIQKRPSVLGEVDFVGLVISVVKSEFVESGKEQDIVYAADINGDILGIKFWTGVKAAGLGDVLGEGKVFCCCNLMDKSLYRSTILPVVEYSGEFSQISHTARNSSQRKAVDMFKKIVPKTNSKTEFLREGKEKLNELLQRKRNSYLKRTPEKQQATTKSIVPDDSKDTFSYQQSGTVSEAFNPKQCISTSSDSPEQGISLMNDCIKTSKLVSPAPSCQGQGTSFLNGSLRSAKSPTGNDQEHPSTDENGQTPNKSLNQIKMSKLLSYGSPASLSPLPATLNNRKTNKAFKPPILTKKPP